MTETRSDTISWRPVLTVHQWNPEQVGWLTRRLGETPTTTQLHDVYHPHLVFSRGNVLTTAGLARLTSLFIGAGGQVADNAHTRIGIGNGVTAEDPAQSDLAAAAGATNRWFQLMDATYPQASNGVLTFKATVGVSDANFTWAEWGIDIGATTNGTTVNAPLLNRKVAALGTKASGAIWALTATITIS